MTVHVFGCGVHDDVSAKCKRTAQNRRGKGVVYDERDAVVVSQSGKLFDVEHMKCRIGDGLAENSLGVRTNFLL